MTDLFIEDIPYEEIVGDLNEVTGRKFKPMTPLYIERIQNQWKNGARLKDFKKVNRVMTKDWKGTNMEKHLNPDVLYGDKFDKYLNSPDKTNVSERTRNNKSASEQYKRSLRG